MAIVLGIYLISLFVGWFTFLLTLLREELTISNKATVIFILFFPITCLMLSLAVYWEYLKQFYRYLND